MKTVVCIALTLMFAAGPVAATPCVADSGAQRVTLLELYTSEGCNSCPPADRWASSLPARGLGPDQVVTLAYHVDYWNDLGWEDPFAQTRFTERQQFANARIGNRTIYTPQFMLDGQDYRQWRSHDGIRQRIASADDEQPGADIKLALDSATDVLDVDARVTLRRASDGASVFVALYENKLASQVTAGENAGKRLEHDFVVRELAGPFDVDTAAIRHRFRVSQAWKPRNLAVAVFVQSAVTGEVLQAMALPWCD